MDGETNNQSHLNFFITARKNCDACNIQDIHVNDWENHTKSRKHRSKLRAKSKEHLEKDGTQENFMCVYCNRMFTDHQFYNVHLGTKTHRRNQKEKVGIRRDHSQPPTDGFRLTAVFGKRGRRVDIHGNEELRTGFIRKKYKIRNLKTDDLNYKSYIYSLTAYLSLRLALNQHVQDFAISVNDKDLGAFGDITINLIYKEKNIIYAIQCKKVSQTFRQINYLEEAKLHMERQYDHLAELKAVRKDLGITKFVIVTTCNTSSDFCKTLTLKSKVLNKWKTGSTDISNDVTVHLKPLTKKNDLVNVTSEPENIFSFLLTDKVECELPYIFLYTNQRVHPTMLNQLLKLRFDNYPDISNQYMKYLENWGEGKLGGNYKLRKKDIILKLGEILLEPFTVSPKKVYSKHDISFDIWNSVLDRVDLTVVKNELFVISKMCQPLNKIIEETLLTNIDTVMKSINLRKEGQSILDHIKDPIKSYLFEVTQDQLKDDIPLHLIYSVFWKAGKIPLLLNSEEQEDAKGFILDVILFMKQAGVNKKFLLKTADLNLNRFKEHVTIFTSLDDIRHLINLDEIKIRVSDSFSLSLNMLYSSDPFFFKYVTPNMFFDLSIGKYNLKAGSQRTQKTKNELKIILSDDYKEILERNLYDQKDLLRLNSSSYIDEKLRGIAPGLI